MSKTIEEIKNQVAKEFLHPYRTWLENSRFSNDDNISVLEDSGAIDEVVNRYAQSQTQELQEQNAELVKMLEYIFYKTNFQNHFPTTSIKVKNLLTKYNHLKSKTNETDKI